MTRNEMTDQAVRRGFRKLYEHPAAFRCALRNVLRNGKMQPGLQGAILIAWDNLNKTDGSSRDQPSPTPKSAGPQAPSFPMNKADHAGGLAIKERA